MERRQSIMRRRGKTFLSLFLSAVIVTGQPVLAADFSLSESTVSSKIAEASDTSPSCSVVSEINVSSPAEKSAANTG